MSQQTPPHSAHLLRQPLGRLAVPVGLGLVLQWSPVHASGFLDPGPFNQSNWSGSPTLTACPIEDPVGCYTFASNTSLFIASVPSATTTFSAGPIPQNASSVLVSFTYAFEPANNFQSAYYSIGTQQYSLSPSLGSTINFGLQSGDQLAFVISSDESAEPAFLTITQFEAVPAPLPLLGGAAAFGWIRRRRAFLRNASSTRKALKP